MRSETEENYEEMCAASKNLNVMLDGNDVNIDSKNAAFWSKLYIGLNCPSQFTTDDQKPEQTWKNSGQLRFTADSILEQEWLARTNII